MKKSELKNIINEVITEAEIANFPPKEQDIFVRIKRLMIENDVPSIFALPAALHITNIVSTLSSRGPELTRQEIVALTVAATKIEKISKGQ